jgi:hypothetical protein
MRRKHLLAAVLVAALSPVYARAMEPYLRASCVLPVGDSIIVGNGKWYGGANNINWNISEVLDANGREEPRVLDSLDTGMGWVEALVAHPSGDVFAAGPFNDLQRQVSHWLVRRRRQPGEPWITVDQWVRGGASSSTAVAGAAVDSRGSVYMLGKSPPILRMSRDRGDTWQTIRQFSGREVGLAGIAIDGRDRLFVLGNDERGWFVERGTASGPWETLDTFRPPWPEPVDVSTRRLGFDRSGRIWAWGHIQTRGAAGYRAATHLRFSDAGGERGSWKDLFEPGADGMPLFKSAWEFWTTRTGDLYVSLFHNLARETRSLLYRSGDRGVSWQQIASFRLDQVTTIRHFTEDAQGTLYLILESHQGTFRNLARSYLAVSSDRGRTWKTRLLSKAPF